MDHCKEEGNTGSESSEPASGSAANQWRRLISALQRWQRDHRGEALTEAAQSTDGSHNDNRRLTRQDTHRITHKQMVTYLQNVRNDMIKQLNSYSLALTVLVTITFVASLQPPGSFSDNGKAFPSNFITAFMFFATLSFLFACIGLCTGVVGSITLLRPGFFPKFTDLANNLNSARSLRQQQAQAPDHHVDQPTDVEGDDETVPMDPVDLLGELVLDNLSRVRRLAWYMGCSLCNCVVAFLMAGLAVIDEEKERGRLIALLVAIGIGGLALFFEAGLIACGPTVCRHKEMKALKGLKGMMFLWKSQHPAPTTTRHSNAGTGNHNAVNGAWNGAVNGAVNEAVNGYHNA